MHYMMFAIVYNASVVRVFFCADNRILWLPFVCNVPYRGHHRSHQHADRHDGTKL